MSDTSCVCQNMWYHLHGSIIMCINFFFFFYEKILLIKMYRTHSHISFLINFHRPNWTFYWKSYAVQWVMGYLLILKTLATCFGYYWVCLMHAANQAAQQMMQRDSCWFMALCKWLIKMNKICLFALHVRKKVFS